MSHRPEQEPSGRSAFGKHLLHSARTDRVPSGSMRRALVGAGVSLPLLALIRTAGAAALRSSAGAKLALLLTLGSAVAIPLAAGNHRSQMHTPATVMQVGYSGAVGVVSAAPAPTAELAMAAAVALEQSSAVPTLTAAPIATSSNYLNPQRVLAIGSTSAPRELTRPTTAAQEAAQPTSEPAAATEANVAQEAATLSKVRSALRGGDLQNARAELGAYDALGSRRQLGVEADVLHIELEAAAGNRNAAATLARSFLSRHPDCQLADRVKRAAGLDAADTD